jgi:hypothetical protein
MFFSSSSNWFAMTFYYRPTVAEAFASVQYIMTEVNFWLVNSFNSPLVSKYDGSYDDPSCLQKPPTSHLQDTTCQRLSSSLLSLSLKDTLTSFATKFLTLSWMLALLPTPTPKLLAKPPARLVW